MRLSRVVGFSASPILHALAAAGILRLAALPQAPIPARRIPDGTLVFVVSPADRSTPPGLKPVDTSESESVIRRNDEPSGFTMPGFAFDFAKVADRATLLFPFVTPGLSLEQFGLDRPHDAAQTLSNPFARAPDAVTRAHAQPPLVLDDAELQSLVDKCWSRRDRWSAIQPLVALADAYDPDAGSLPAVFRAYLDQDGLQPYVDTVVRDPRLWAELDLAADHVQFVGFISRYAAAHRSTRATTELLFLLDQVVQANLDTLVALLDVSPEHDLQWTRRASRGAFDLLVELRRRYQAQLERRGLASVEALTAFYGTVRLDILTGILRTTPQGYRAADARFLMGSVYWKEGRVGDALQAWRDMTVNPGDTYATASADTLLAISRPVDPSDPKALAARIDRILALEYGRWRSFSATRLRQFGYHFDTY
jgi:hypothetical protein